MFEFYFWTFHWINGSYQGRKWSWWMWQGWWWDMCIWECGWRHRGYFHRSRRWMYSKSAKESWRSKCTKAWRRRKQTFPWKLSTYLLLLPCESRSLWSRGQLEEWGGAWLRCWSWNWRSRRLTQRGKHSWDTLVLSERQRGNCIQRYTWTLQKKKGCFTRDTHTRSK